MNLPSFFVLAQEQKTPPFFHRWQLYFSLYVTSRVSKVAGRLYTLRANIFYDSISHKKMNGHHTCHQQSLMEKLHMKQSQRQTHEPTSDFIFSLMVIAQHCHIFQSSKNNLLKIFLCFSVHTYPSLNRILVGNDRSAKHVSKVHSLYFRAD